MPHRFDRGISAALALSLVFGCAGWFRYDPPADTTLDVRQGVQVWRDSKPLILHAVRVTEDSLVGVSFYRPPSCDSCRIAMLRSDVDSLRLGNPEAAGIASWAIPIFVVFAVVATIFPHYKD
jgi:hypothetical protein